jgi:hypothetical protein
VDLIVFLMVCLLKNVLVTSDGRTYTERGMVLSKREVVEKSKTENSISTFRLTRKIVSFVVWPLPISMYILNTYDDYDVGNRLSVCGRCEVTMVMVHGRCLVLKVIEINTSAAFCDNRSFNPYYNCVKKR